MTSKLIIIGVVTEWEDSRAKAPDCLGKLSDRRVRLKWSSAFRRTSHQQKTKEAHCALDNAFSGLAKTGSGFVWRELKKNTRRM
jgi:hypothetical protein